MRALDLTSKLANKDESLCNYHTCLGSLFAAERGEDRQCLQAGVLCCQVYIPIPYNSNTQHHPANTSPRHASTTLTTHPQPQQHSLHRRPFTTTPTLLKKGGKAAALADDPADFSALEADIAAAVTRLKDDLSKLRAGGRFNPELLENLRVQPDKSSASKVRLSDVAQVVPKGRTVQVLVGEKDVCYKFLFEKKAYGGRTNVSTHSTSNPSPLPSKARTSLSRPSQILREPTLSS